MIPQPRAHLARPVPFSCLWMLCPDGLGSASPVMCQLACRRAGTGRLTDLNPGNPRLLWPGCKDVSGAKMTPCARQARKERFAIPSTALGCPRGQRRSFTPWRGPQDLPDGIGAGGDAQEPCRLRQKVVPGRRPGLVAERPLHRVPVHGEEPVVPAHGNPLLAWEDHGLHRVAVGDGAHAAQDAQGLSALAPVLGDLVSVLIRPRWASQSP
jgi:hypothetical protein